MGSKADEYRRKAEEAEKRAADALDPEAKRLYRDIAARWVELAEQADRHNW